MVRESKLSMKTVFFFFIYRFVVFKPVVPSHLLSFVKKG